MDLKPEHEITLHCTLGCGREVGVAQVFEPTTEAEYRQTFGIIDQRCTPCESTHGAFRDLVDEFKWATRESNEEAAVDFVLAHPKRNAAFRSALRVETEKAEQKRGELKKASEERL